MSLKEASKNISLFANLLKPIIEAGPELERIGNLEQYEKKLNGDIDNLKKEELEITTRIDNERTRLNQEIKNHQDNVEATNQQFEVSRKSLENFKAEKNKEALKLISDARAEAATVIDEASKKAKQIVDDAEYAIKDRNKIIKAKDGTIVQLDKEIDERNKKLADINKQLKEMIKA